MANISNNGPSIHVVQGCPDVATECVAYVGTFNSGGALNLSDVVLLSGNTYFVVLSNSSSSRTYTYSLIIQRNPCINPTIASTTNIADCGTGMFTVDVDVSYLGSATTLTLSDDNASTSDVTGINMTGLVNMGPYPSGTIVNFTLTNDDDNSCLSEGSSYFYCPPTNDECGAPISLTVNTDDSCSITVSATNAGATESVTDPDNCASASNQKNDVWFSFEALSDTTILEYLNIVPTPGYLSGGTIQATELLEGTCGSLTSIACYTTNFVTFSNLTIGQTYYIRNNTRLNGEYAQNYDICLRNPPAAPFNDECIGAGIITVPTLVGTPEVVSGTTVGATTSANNSCNTSDISDVWYTLNPSTTGIYEISFAENPTNQPAVSTFYIYEGSCASLAALSTSCNSSSAQILPLVAGTDYYVMVQSTQTGPGVTFDLTVNRLPDAVANSDCSGAFTLTESVDMNGNNSISGNINVTDVAYYSAEGCASSSTESVWYTLTPQYTGMYNFNFTRVSGSASYTVYNTDDCSQAGTNYVTGISSCFNNTTPRTGDLVAGNTYLIMVHASSAAEYTILAYPDPSLSVESNNFETFKYYPNPVVNTLTIEAGNTISNVSIYNIVGQQVQVNKPNNLKTTVNMNALEDGVYFVTVTINDAQKTFKVIKK